MLMGGDDDAFYTLILLRPDDELPIRPVLHHLVGNIKGSDLKAGDISAGTVLGAYEEPNPPGAWNQLHFVYMVY